MLRVCTSKGTCKLWKAPSYFSSFLSLPRLISSFLLLAFLIPLSFSLFNAISHELLHLLIQTPNLHLSRSTSLGKTLIADHYSCIDYFQHFGTESTAAVYRFPHIFRLRLSLTVAKLPTRLVSGHASLRSRLIIIIQLTIANSLTTVPLLSAPYLG